jgi:hypothetical protein
MDPEATLIELLESIRDRDSDGILEAANSLALWSIRGGYVPNDIDRLIKIAQAGHWKQDNC